MKSVGSVTDFNARDCAPVYWVQGPGPAHVAVLLEFLLSISRLRLSAH